MPKSKVREPSMAVRKLVEEIRREVAAKLGPDSTFEERREASAELMRDALAKMVDEDECEDHAEGHRRGR